jgi:hypothetical protein
MSDNDTRNADKKTYHPPRIVHTEKLQGMAVSCNKADDSCSSGGAIQS